MAEKTVNVGANILVEKNGKVLLGKRINITGGGTWGFPGGHLEVGESIIAAAKRELKEETGLIADELELVNVINQPVRPEGDGKHFIQFNFKATKFHGEVVNCEPERCAGWEWFDINNPPKEIFFAHTQFLSASRGEKVLIDPEV